jgi:hypothetical protein
MALHAALLGLSPSNAIPGPSFLAISILAARQRLQWPLPCVGLDSGAFDATRDPRHGVI